MARLSGLPADRILPEAFRLTTPASPHLAARIDGVTIDLDDLALPQVDGPLVIEGAGGVLVPISETLLMADLFAHWGQPVILCARTGLGTINHSLLSIEALRSRNVPIAGIALILGVDRFMSECRALTNFVGNAVATIVVARWEGELDRDALKAALDGQPLPLAAPSDPAAGPGDKAALAAD